MATQTKDDSNLSPSAQLQWYFDQSAEGDIQATRELGRMYFHGFTHPDDPAVEIQPDPEIAANLLTEAADEGDGQAAMLLGQLLDGEATQGSFDMPEEAFRRYQQTVDLDYRPARFYLGTRYLIGRGVNRDDEMGRRILIEAAYAGDTDAQAFMAEIYEKDGDDEGAAAWRVVASLFGSELPGEVVGMRVPIGMPERVRFIIQKVNVYSTIVQCDAPELIAAADLLRNSFCDEI